MKKLSNQILAFIALLIACIAPVYSADIFSHTVLVMPYDLDPLNEYKMKVIIFYHRQTIRNNRFPIHPYTPYHLVLISA
jgi:hypothetical protein